MIGKTLWYVMLTLGIVNVVNIPIQVVQLVLIGHLSFPYVTLPVQVPWYLLVSGIFCGMLLLLLVFGILMAKLGIADEFNQTGNDNNPVIREIVPRLEKIEKLLEELERQKHLDH